MKRWNLRYVPRKGEMAMIEDLHGDWVQWQDAKYFRVAASQASERERDAYALAREYAGQIDRLEAELERLREAAKGKK